ncbi:ABC transporter permease [Acidisphaera sp. S103]|uniref:ABC transporter permease n=1 Tax=Acidisphaera sp. S103 TaxID=1747223 RepID=UPI00131D28D4|nr:ABC transporter permease subunit [Acidisphaera sp. S103]
MTNATRLSLRLTGLALFLIIWEGTGRYLGDALMAPPSAVARELVALAQDAGARETIWQSIAPALVGFAIACVVGMPMGVVMGRSPVWNALLQPWVSTFVVTSVAAIVPILILLIGTGWWFVVAVVVLSSVWYITLTTYQGAVRIERRWLDVGRSFGASRIRSFRTIMLPALFPYLLAGARIGLTHAIRSMVLAQLFIVTGIGGMLNEAGMDVSTARLLALLVVIMGIGLLASHGLGRLADWLAPWQRGLEPRR